MIIRVGLYIYKKNQNEIDIVSLKRSIIKNYQSSFIIDRRVFMKSTFIKN